MGQLSPKSLIARDKRISNFEIEYLRENQKDHKTRAQVECFKQNSVLYVEMYVKKTTWQCPFKTNCIVCWPARCAQVLFYFYFIVRFSVIYILTWKLLTTEGTQKKADAVDNS